MAVGHLLSTTTFDVLVWVTVVLPRGPASSAAATSGSGCSSASSSASGSRTRTSCCSCSARSPAAASSTAASASRAALGSGRAPRSRSLLWLPNLLWQAHHGWPQLELADKIGDEDPIGNRVQLLPLQLLLDRPAPRTALARRALVAPAPRRGATVSSARARLPRPARGRASSTGGKPYYTMGLLLALLGAGAVVAERRLAAGKTTRAQARRSRSASPRSSRLRSRSRSCPSRDRARDADPRRSTRTRSRRSAGPPSPRRSRGSGTGLPPAERANAVVFTRQLRRGGRDRPLRPGARDPARLLRATTPSGASAARRDGAAPDHRDRLPQPARPPAAPSAAASARGPDRQRRRTSTTRSRAPPSGCARPPSALVDALAAAAPPRPVMRPISGRMWP